jgi:hypothetical protein
VLLNKWILKKIHGCTFYSIQKMIKIIRKMFLKILISLLKNWLDKLICTYSIIIKTKTGLIIYQMKKISLGHKVKNIQKKFTFQKMINYIILIMLLVLRLRHIYKSKKQLLKFLLNILMKLWFYKKRRNFLSIF